MGKVLKDRKTILRTFMSNLKAKKQADDSKGSYQKAQERVIARKTALARKRARETAAKHQAALKAVIEDDKLLPNQDPMLNLGQSIALERDQGYSIGSAIQLTQRGTYDPLLKPVGLGDLVLHPTPDPSIGERFLKHGTTE